MRLLAVITEGLAVIAGDDHQCRLPRRPQIVKQRRQRRIGRRHFSVVRPACVRGVERRRRPVRRVWIEEV